MGKAGKADREMKEAIASDIIQLIPLDTIMEKYGISKSTLYRIRQDAEFKAILSEKRMIAWETAIDNAYAMAEVAAKTIIDVLKDEKASPKVRMDAATRILNLTKEHYAEVEVIARVDELKAIIEKMER